MIETISLAAEDDLYSMARKGLSRHCHITVINLA